MMRLTDDYLLMTSDESVATSFVRRMEAGRFWRVWVDDVAYMLKYLDCIA